MKKITNQNIRKVLIEHGIRVSDGYGEHCYYCIRCKESFDSSEQMLVHIKRFTNTDDLYIEELNFEQTFNPFNVNDLDKEDIEYCRKNEKLNQFKCRLCKSWINSSDMNNILIHIKTAKHLKEKRLKGIDRYIVNDIKQEIIGLLITQKKALINFGNFYKQKALIHGLKVVNGSGLRAFFCTKCNQYLSNTKQHLDLFNESIVKPNHLLINPNLLTNERLDQLLRKEGIVKKNFDNVNDLGEVINRDNEEVMYCCNCCEIRFYRIHDVIQHLNSLSHQYIKNINYQNN